ncbi:MAG: ATP-binding protein [Planctomycetes bacterium]|nr:ATP-binding protein [Planctomycetota bacterium]
MHRRRLDLRLRFAGRENLARVRALVASLLREETDVPFRDDEVDEIVLGLQEILTNVLRHAYGGDPTGRVDLRVVVFGGRFLARVRDRGAPVRADALAMRTPSADAEAGRGLMLVRRTMDRVRYGRRGQVNFVHLERRAQAAGAPR